MADRELLVSVTKKDFVVTYYKGSGAGGQKRNKTMSGVRLQHPDSGAMVECCDTPSQHQNKATALRRLAETPEFKRWLRIANGEALLSKEQKAERARREEAAIQKAVDLQMHPDNLLIETFTP